MIEDPWWKRQHQWSFEKIFTSHDCFAVYKKRRLRAFHRQPCNKCTTVPSCQQCHCGDKWEISGPLSSIDDNPKCWSFISLHFVVCYKGSRFENWGLDYKGVISLSLSLSLWCGLENWGLDYKGVMYSLIVLNANICDMNCMVIMCYFIVLNINVI